MKKLIPLEQMPDKSIATLKRLSDADLHRFIAGWRPGTEDHIAGMRELERRQARTADIRSWIAIAIALSALIVSALQFLLFSA